jgi:hypothetical protein
MFTKAMHRNSAKATEPRPFYVQIIDAPDISLVAQCQSTTQTVAGTLSALGSPGFC